MASKKKIHDHPELLGMPELKKLWQTEGLFSDHYLKVRLSQNDWWPTDTETQSLWQFCKDLYERRYLACAKNNEAFTRQELLDKILEQLGFAYTDNLNIPDQDTEPDYILFGSAPEKETVIEADTAQRYRSAVAILEAKKLNHPLSQRSKSQQRYPHQQIRDYLNDAQVLSWGILTNGNEWRLYCRDTKPSHFFGLNFEQALKSLEGFKVFLALFSPAAFVRDAQGKSRLDYVREQALEAQVALEEDLRQRVFTLVEILANGFIERSENQITDADLPSLYENSLIFLYRLLFILYAEGRQLLPVEPKSRKYYKELSLMHRIPELKGFQHDSHTRTRLYEDVLELCHLINGTDEKKNKEYSVRLLDESESAVMERALESGTGLGDVFAMFVERGAELTRNCGLSGWIIVEDDFVINKSYLLAIPKRELPYLPEFVLAILNSRLVSKAFVSMSEIAKRDDFPQLDIATVCELPFPRIEFTTPEGTRAILLDKAKQLYQHIHTDENAIDVLAFVAEHVAAKPRRLDVVHDLLAFLAAKMITLKTQKWNAAKQFLTDLKDFDGIDVGMLNPKTRLDEFWKLESAELFAHLRKNAKKLAAQNIRLTGADEEKIRDRFQNATQAILPLEAPIAFTDSLIDQIVYRLYGLTTEEIRIVEAVTDERQKGQTVPTPQP